MVSRKGLQPQHYCSQSPWPMSAFHTFRACWQSMPSCITVPVVAAWSASMPPIVYVVMFPPLQ
jgi:hypothetical protein